MDRNFKFSINIPKKTGLKILIGVALITAAAYILGDDIMKIEERNGI